MKIITLLPERIIAINDFLSPVECQTLIDRAEGIGFEAASVGTKHGAEMRTDIRNNDRAIFDDQELAAEMWDRVAPFVPSPLWKRRAIGLNERWRFYRYEAGQVFKRHQDGSIKREGDEKTQMTLLLYLNQGCIGGQTRFYLHDRAEPLDVEPMQGMALLFLHTFWHEGTSVLEGQKYVLRSDVFYSAPEITIS